MVSLIAILCFSSVTQGWMIVKLKLHEALLLLVVVVGLFRPDVLLDRVSPSFRAIDAEQLVAGEAALEPGRKIRLHVVRETDYGDRFKLFVLETPQPGDVGRQGPYGLTLLPLDDGRYEVAAVAFNDVAETTGVDFGDFVTSADVEQLGRPPKEIVYPFALAVLALVIGLQFRRWRRPAAKAASA